jgi:hypothetical protein
MVWRACRAKELWGLVNDQDTMVAEREKAAKNRNKYGGMDRFGVPSSSSTSGADRGSSYGDSVLGRPTVTTPATNNTPRESSAVAAVDATEQGMQQLHVSSSNGHMPGLSPVLLQAKPKPKLSDIAVSLPLLWSCTAQWIRHDASHLYWPLSEQETRWLKVLL